MGGLFGVASKSDCVFDLFFGTDYHSHLGTRRAGMVVCGENGFQRAIHNIENAPFRTKFERDLNAMEGHLGIGCISDLARIHIEVLRRDRRLGQHPLPHRRPGGRDYLGAPPQPPGTTGLGPELRHSAQTLGLRPPLGEQLHSQKSASGCRKRSFSNFPGRSADPASQRYTPALPTWSAVHP